MQVRKCGNQFCLTIEKFLKRAYLNNVRLLRLEFSPSQTPKLSFNPTQPTENSEFRVTADEYKRLEELRLVVVTEPT